MGLTETIIPLRVGGREIRIASHFRNGGEDLLLFVHGLGCSKQNFVDAWQQPAFRDCALLAIDLPGFGRSPSPDGYSCSLQDHARIIAALIDANASRRIHLVAHSMGGTVALMMNPRVHARLSGLMLVEARLLLDSSTVAREISTFEYPEFESDFLPAFRRRSKADPRAAFDADRAEASAFYTTACSMAAALESENLVERFLQAQCPKLFVYGKENLHLAELKHLPAELLHGIDSAGHFVMQDNPDAFYELLKRWMSHQEIMG